MCDIVRAVKSFIGEESKWLSDDERKPLAMIKTFVRTA